MKSSVRRVEQLLNSYIGQMDNELRARRQKPTENSKAYNERMNNYFDPTTFLPSFRCATL